MYMYPVHDVACLQDLSIQLLPAGHATRYGARDPGGSVTAGAFLPPAGSRPAPVRPLRPSGRSGASLVPIPRPACRSRLIPAISRGTSDGGLLPAPVTTASCSIRPRHSDGRLAPADGAWRPPPATIRATELVIRTGGRFVLHRARSNTCARLPGAAATVARWPAGRHFPAEYPLAARRPLR